MRPVLSQNQVSQLAAPICSLDSPSDWQARAASMQAALQASPHFSACAPHGIGGHTAAEARMGHQCMPCTATPPFTLTAQSLTLECLYAEMLDATVIANVITYARTQSIGCALQWNSAAQVAVNWSESPAGSEISKSCMPGQCSLCATGCCGASICCTECSGVAATGLRYLQATWPGWQQGKSAPTKHTLAPTLWHFRSTGCTFQHPAAGTNAAGLNVGVSCTVATANCVDGPQRRAEQAVQTFKCP